MQRIFSLAPSKGDSDNNEPWKITRYNDEGLASQAARGVNTVLGYLPQRVFIFAFRLVVSLPPAISRFSTYWLTQPEFETLDKWRRIKTSEFEGALLNLDGGGLRRADVTILYVHGGAGIVGHARMWSSFFAELLQSIEIAGDHEKSAQLLSVEYTLATAENPPPLQQNQVMAAYDFLLSQGVKPEKIIIAGDSAGAFFSLRSIMDYPKSHDSKPMTLGGALLISPWAELNSDYPADKSWKLNASNDFVTSSFLFNGVKNLHPTSSSSSEQEKGLAEMSPAFASQEDLDKLPPTLVTVGDKEVLRGSIERFCATLKNKEVLRLAAPHDWVCLDLLCEEGMYGWRKEAIGRIGRWISEVLKWE